MKTLIIIFTIFILSTLAYRIASEKEILGYQMFVVETGSMGNEVPKGSIVTVGDLPEYDVGDIVTFRYPLNVNRTITHRIVGVDEEDSGFITKGDIHSMNDPWTLTDDLIVGNVRFVIPLVGYGISFFKSTVGFLFIIIPVGILLAHESRTAFKEALELRAKISHRHAFRIMKIRWMIRTTFLYKLGRRMMSIIG